MPHIEVKFTLPIPDQYEPSDLAQAYADGVSDTLERLRASDIYLNAGFLMQYSVIPDVNPTTRS